MKNLLLLLISFFYLFQLNAQKTYVPDDVFEDYIETSFPGASDGIPNNDSVFTIGLQTTGPYNIVGSFDPIMDFTGIEDINGITSLNITGVPAASIDLSSMTTLATLIIEDNWQLQELKLPNSNIGTMFITNNNLLEILDFGSNTTVGGGGGINISTNYTLEVIDMSMVAVTSPLPISILNNTNLTCLNIANGGNMFLSSVQLNDNPVMYSVIVDDPNYSNSAPLWSWSDQALWNVFNIGNPNNPYQYLVSGNCTLGVSELNNTSKQLIKIVDLIGLETNLKPNTPLLYIYDDGTVERRMTIKP